MHVVALWLAARCAVGRSLPAADELATLGLQAGSCAVRLGITRMEYTAETGHKLRWERMIKYTLC